MATADLSRNLRLLCSYGRSVSDVCRRAGINRQQFERYLTGTAAPSLRTLRRLADFFGLEDHEIFLDHATFAALVRLRPPRLQASRDRVTELVAALADQPAAAGQRYAGYYHVYFQPDRLVPEVHRCLTELRMLDGSLVSRTVERYPNGAAGLPSTVRYEGVALSRGGKLIVLERQARAGHSAFFTVLDGSTYREMTYLSGLTLGIAPDGSRTSYCLRIVWHFLGTEVRLRERLAQCGQLPLDSPEISRYLRHCIANELTVGDAAFSPRA